MKLTFTNIKVSEFRTDFYEGPLEESHAVSPVPLHVHPHTPSVLSHPPLSHSLPDQCHFGHPGTEKWQDLDVPDVQAPLWK